MRLIFSHRPAYRASLPFFLYVNQGHWHSLLWGVFSVRVALFPSDLDTSKVFDLDTVATRHFVQNCTENTLVKFHFVTVNSIWDMGL